MFGDERLAVWGFLVLALLVLLQIQVQPALARLRLPMVTAAEFSQAMLCAAAISAACIGEEER